MNEFQVADLTAYLDRVNTLNDFDLAWRWTPRTTPVPEIEVYEIADGHVLAEGNRDNIIDRVKRDLHLWNLKDPDDV